MFVRQVGYVINVGPLFVVPVGSQNKVMMLQCSVEEINGSLVWVTKVKEPIYVAVLNGSDGDTFPYTREDTSIEGHYNDEYVSLGIDGSAYKMPNFGAKDYKGSYQNIASDWLNNDFRASNLIRNKSEYNAAGGNPKIPVNTPTTDPVKVPTGGVGTPGGGNGTGVVVGGNSTNTTPVNRVTTQNNTPFFIGLGVITILVLLAQSKD